MHHAALNGTGPDNRHLDHEVIKIARLQTRQHGHLRPAFDLKDTDGIRLAQHVVHVRVVLRHGCKLQIDAVMIAQKIECTTDAGKHAKRQHIDFQNAKCIEIVLVPFDKGAIFHCRIANGHDFFQRPFGNDEAPDMLRQVPWKADRSFASSSVCASRLSAGSSPMRCASSSEMPLLDQPQLERDRA